MSLIIIYVQIKYHGFVYQYLYRWSAITGSIKGFITIAKKHNPQIITTHCFLHREALVAKSISNDLKNDLAFVVQTVNYVHKNQTVEIRLFSKLGEAMDSKQLSFLTHIEIRNYQKDDFIMIC